MIKALVLVAETGTRIPYQSYESQSVKCHASPKNLTYTQPVTLNFTMPTHSNKIPAHA